MKNTTEVAQALCELLAQELKEPDSLSEMESQTREMLVEIGRETMEMWAARLAEPNPVSTTQCECGHGAKYLFKRKGMLRTVFGKVSYRRAYYVCEVCHQGRYPLDKQLGLRPNAMSAELERLAGMTGVQIAFGKGSKLLEELALIALSDQSLDKATQAYGKEMEHLEVEWKREAADEEQWLRRQREAKRPRRLYGTIDGLNVPVRDKEEGVVWRELKMGAWFEARGHPPKTRAGEWTIQAEHITYYADICEAKAFGTLLWATGFHRNAHLAVELVFLADGAKWIWDLIEEHFPQAIQIVDWFHACQYIAPVAQAAFKDSQQRECWCEQVKSALWEGRLDEVIAACQEFVHPDREDDPAQAAVTYYTNNRHRMDYPTYRANGYQIGSGTIESVAKQIGLHRLKIPGARWNLDSARWVAKARAAFLSNLNLWDDLAARRIHLDHAA